MMFFAGRDRRFVDRHPTIKMLALSFLMLIGVTLVAEGFDVHIPKGYIYFAMAFSVGVEMLNVKYGRGPRARCTCGDASRKRSSRGRSRQPTASHDPLALVRAYRGRPDGATFGGSVGTVGAHSAPSRCTCPLPSTR